MRWVVVLLIFAVVLVSAKKQQKSKNDYQRVEVPRPEPRPATSSAMSTSSPEPIKTVAPAPTSAPTTTTAAAATTQESAGEITEEDHGVVRDVCDWLPERLNGRCWGLQATTTFKDDKGIQQKKIANAMDCQKLCCELGDKCVSYQYIVSSKTCTIGKEVRLGKETGKTDLWCDPIAPHKWTGHVLIHHPVGTCSWGAHLPYQCWDFGAERLSADGQRLSARDCANACCKLADCEAFQEHPTRGCFYNDKPTDGGVDCDGGLEIYHGRRKKRPS